MDNISKLLARINDMFEDIRAEVIVSDLLASGVHSDDLLIRFVGQLKRPRSSDIASVQIAKNNSSNKQLELILNRDSIYDTLPEGVFHQPSPSDSKTISVASMVEEYRRQQHEEAEARQFFSPFENELFLQKSFTESEEFKQLFQIQQSRLNATLLEALGIDTSLPQEFTSKLLRMLPYTSKISGNISQTEQLFTLLLNDPVALEADQFSDIEKSENCSFLGETTLGDDIVIGNGVIPGHNLINLTVGPLSKKRLHLYKNNGWKAMALQTLINFIIPVEWDIIININIKQEDVTSFTLNDQQADARLGYTTSLLELA